MYVNKKKFDKYIIYMNTNIYKDKLLYLYTKQTNFKNKKNGYYSNSQSN